VFGVPVGLSLFRRAYSEPTRLRLAHAFEAGDEFTGAAQVSPCDKARLISAEPLLSARAALYA
jgi:hypothetical protein